MTFDVAIAVSVSENEYGMHSFSESRESVGSQMIICSSSAALVAVAVAVAVAVSENKYGSMITK